VARDATRATARRRRHRRDTTSTKTKTPPPPLPPPPPSSPPPPPPPPPPQLRLHQAEFETNDVRVISCESTFRKRWDMLIALTVLYEVSTVVSRNQRQ